MPAATYAYKVRDKQGHLVTGQLEADNQAAVAAKLRQMGYSPILIEEQKTTGVKREVKLPWKNGVKGKDLAVFSRQFATMINSGLSLLRALNILADQTENQTLAKVVGEVRSDVERGASLSASMAKHPKIFSRLYVSMIRAGEIGGVLDSVLLRLAENLEKEVALKQKIKSAMTYPVVVFIMVIMIVSGMLLFVVPMFENLYKDLGGKLPLPTQLLINVSNIMKKMWFLVIGAGIGAGIAFKRWIVTDKGRASWDAVKLKAPIFGDLVHKTALSRFSRTLGVLIRSGVPILQSLDIVKETSGNAVVGKATQDVQRSVKDGESIAKPLERHAVFPAMVVQMIAVGEETGALDTMLEKIADFYDQEVEATVDALTSLIEPLLIAVMGMVVGGMVVALYMPMFNIINLIQ
ncbi:MAG TPA: type II secretion system F family protein [Actinomycetota bacterium]|nr:type II secretion system F family protein [Actinomycetota bacterium]